MRRFASIGSLFAASAVVIAAHGQPADGTRTGKPRTYALVAAFSDRFAFVYETPPRERSASARVDRYRRSTVEAARGTFNRVALAGLERAITASDPGAASLHLALSGSIPAEVTNVDQEDYLFRRVLEDLARMPERHEWHRIVVALPAFQPLDIQGLPDRLAGFGVVLQPNCQSNPYSCGQAFGPPGGPRALTPDGREIAVSFFVAPYSSVSVRVLDPVTLEVLDHRTALEHRKMYDPQSGTLDLGRNIPRRLLAEQVVTQVERSVGSALAQTGLAGRVIVHDVKEVTPGSAGK